MSERAFSWYHKTLGEVQLLPLPHTGPSLYTHTYTQFREERSSASYQLFPDECFWLNVASRRQQAGSKSREAPTQALSLTDSTLTHRYRKANYTDTWSTALQRDRSLKYENLVMIYPNFSPNLYDFLYSVEHNRRYLHIICVILFHTMKMSGNRYCQDSKMNFHFLFTRFPHQKVKRWDGKEGDTRLWDKKVPKP